MKKVAYFTQMRARKPQLRSPLGGPQFAFTELAESGAFRQSGKQIIA